MKEFVRILGVKINKVTLNSALEKVKEYLTADDNSRPKVIFTPNTEVVMQARNDNVLKDIINNGDLIIPDGIGLIYASKIKRKGLTERVTGFDLSVDMIKLANKEGYKLFLLGGKEDVAKTASEKLLEDYPDLKISGYQHGYFKGAHIGYKDHEEEKEIIKKINDSHTDILFVGLGVPLQEIWINENINKLNCKVIIGNGGTIDVLAGRVPRAPKTFQKLGLEWFYRLIKEPKRIRRQMVLPLFALMVLFSKEKIVE